MVIIIASVANDLHFLWYTHAPHLFTWGYSQNCQEEVGDGGGCNQILLDGNSYQDSACKEWKLVMSNLFFFISKIKNFKNQKFSKIQKYQNNPKFSKNQEK